MGVDSEAGGHLAGCGGGCLKTVLADLGSTSVVQMGHDDLSERRGTWEDSAG